ncbi:Sigma factor regulator VreR (cytoplasmic membrane-localized) of trans-envelope signaling system [plant metagenome]|uniref:Sigma factor regulator VreR (Cytoplasmic membrane-localized) of trans-envelope signaling system n=1 Tax=plant metagenome TaxID=1297885 RepID=A0A484Q5M6_9ZZZZ
MKPLDTFPGLNDTASAVLRKEARDWAVKLKSGQPTQRDVDAFKQWRAQSHAHGQAWRLASEEWRALGGSAQGYLATHPERVPKPTRPSVSRRLFLGAAAGALGSAAVAGVLHPPLGLWPSWQEMGADLRTATGEQRELRLNSQVQVALNTQTSVSLPRERAMPSIALISGEAAVSAWQASCEVRVDDSRIVLTDGDLEVRRLSGGRVRVRCQSGEARVQQAGMDVVLAGPQQLTYDASGVVEAARPLVSSASDWRRGVVVFDNLPLAEAVEEINRYRRGRVVLVNAALADRRFSAAFEITALDDAIALLGAMHKINVRQVGDFVFLS